MLQGMDGHIHIKQGVSSGPPPGNFDHHTLHFLLSGDFLDQLFSCNVIPAESTHMYRHLLVGMVYSSILVCVFC